jgi:hypothetical protein
MATPASIYAFPIFSPTSTSSFEFSILVFLVFLASLKLKFPPVLIVAPFPTETFEATTSISFVELINRNIGV